MLNGSPNLCSMAWWRRLKADNQTTRLRTPNGDLMQIADMPASVAAAFGINASLTQVTRKDAMTLPVVKQGRTLVAGTIGTFPLICSRGVHPVPRPLLEQPDPNTTRAWTITWTVDDLMFYGVAWWYVSSFDAQGYPLTSERIAGARLRLDYGQRKAYIDGTEIDPARLRRFDGPDEGILISGARALRTAIRLEDAANRYALMDMPSGVLKDTRPAGTNLKTDEVEALLKMWRDARALYGTGYLNSSLDYQPSQFNAQQLQLVEARQHMATELARLMGLDAPAVNAPQASGMTYNNGVAERRARVDIAFRPYISAIADRLSLPDVTPRGQTVAFDVSAYLRGDAADAIDAAVAAAGGKAVMSVDEARARLLDMPPMEGTPA